mmetsp:Transcript_9372/g.18007  ORF Transcript_9372/g.18007 Transcript_9372/m.18007 type:complete len:317 (+) Transcript_9372:2244-3194(+)
MITQFLISNSTAIARSVLDDLSSFAFGKVKALTSRIASTTLYVFVRVLVLFCFITLALSAATLEYSLLYNLLIPVTFQSAEIPLHTELDHKQGTILVGTDIFLQNEEYELSILLHVPESQTNYDIGNFDVWVTFDPEKKLGGLGMLKYSSYLLRACRTIAYIFPLMMGWTEEAQVVNVLIDPSLSSHKDLKELKVDIYPRELQVYKAEMQLSTKLSGVRKVMHKYFYSSMLFCVSSLFVFNCAVLTAVFYARYFSPPPPSRLSRRSNSSLPKIDLPNEHEFDLVPRPEAQKYPADFSHILKKKQEGGSWTKMIVLR